MNLAAELGRLLTAERESRGLSRRAVAEAGGVAPNTLREVELGEANPTLARIEELAEVYGVELAIIPTPGVHAGRATPTARTT